MTNVLIVTPFFLPNIGGAETYAFELTEYLRTHGCRVTVHTYQPITTPNVRGKPVETKENLVIRRYKWIGFNLFGKLERFPVLNFFYLTPYLFIRTFIWMLKNHDHVDIIDAQGFNSAIIAATLKSIFRKKAVISVMSLYDFIPNTMKSKLVSFVISRMDHVIVESERSKEELVSVGVSPSKITPYVEWLDLNVFKPYDKEVMRKSLGLPQLFTVFFVGRALEIKGIDIVLECAKRLSTKDISFVIVSNAGPLMREIDSAANALKNVTFIPGVPYSELPKYESAANISLIPSKYSENSAITVIEAISCGTPVIVSNIGALPALVSEAVGVLSEPTTESFTKSILELYEDRDKYNIMQQNCFDYAQQHFSRNNASTIYNVYLDALERKN